MTREEYKFFGIIRQNSRFIKWLRSNSDRIIVVLVVTIIILCVIEYIWGDSEFVLELIRRLLSRGRG